MSGGHSDTAPPDPIPNSVVKRISGDGSVGFPYARVAHRQASIKTGPLYAGFVVSGVWVFNSTPSCLPYNAPCLVLIYGVSTHQS